MKTETLHLNPSLGATTAHVARPDTKTAGAVLLIQEWWGINDHIRDIAGRYANEGYICVAPDLYRGRLAKDADEAARMMHELAMEDGIATIAAALDETKRVYNAQKVGITGFCMGGTFALRAACEVNEFAAAAPFYGDIPGDEVLQKLSVPTLFIAGALDAWINPEKVGTLEDAARKFDLPVEIVSYNADHAFFNDTRPAVYNADAAADAWQRVLELFRKHLAE